MALRITVRVITQTAKCLYTDHNETPQNRQHLEHLYESTFRRTAAVRWLMGVCGALVVCTGLILLLTARACLALDQPMRLQDALPSLIPLLIAVAIVASVCVELLMCTAHGQWRWSWQTARRAVMCCGCGNTNAMSIDELEQQFSPNARLVDVEADMALTGGGDGALVSDKIDASAFDFGDDDDNTTGRIKSPPGQINIPMQTLGSGTGSGRTSPTDQ